MMNYEEIRYRNGKILASGPVDEHGNVVKRTKQSHPYSYDGFVTWRGGSNDKIKDTVYSDRLRQWDREKYKAFSKEVWGNEGDAFWSRKPSEIERFLRLYLDKPTLKLILVMEYCNVSNGYPLWRFDFDPEPAA